MTDGAGETAQRVPSRRQAPGLRVIPPATGFFLRRPGVSEEDTPGVEGLALDPPSSFLSGVLASALHQQESEKRLIVLHAGVGRPKTTR